MDCDPGDFVLSGGFKQGFDTTMALQNSYPTSTVIDTSYLQGPPIRYPVASVTVQGWETDVRTTSTNDLSTVGGPFREVTFYAVCEDSSTLPPLP